MTLSEHASPGTSAAFAYQFHRALYWLADSSAGCRVGIETDDDISVRGSDDSLQALEQDKHTIRLGANPLADRSVALWKTLSIWILALKAAEVDPAKAAFFLVTNSRVQPGLVADLSSASTEDEVTACITKIEMIGADPSNTLRPFIEIVLAPANRTCLVAVVRGCQVLDGSSATIAGSDLLAGVAAKLQLPSWCSSQSESVVNEVLGWMHRVALENWQASRPCWIARDHFVDQLHAILNLRRRARARERAEHLLPLDDLSIGAQKGRRFVRQLYFITEDTSIVDSAIRDFVRCGVEKDRLSAEGNITDEDWVSFESELSSRWTRIQARIRRMSQDKREEDQGFEVFAETTIDHRGRLAGEDTDHNYLTAGTYHRLADAISLGWHPRFRELLDGTA